MTLAIDGSTHVMPITIVAVGVTAVDATTGDIIDGTNTIVAAYDASVASATIVTTTNQRGCHRCYNCYRSDTANGILDIIAAVGATGTGAVVVSVVPAIHIGIAAGNTSCGFTYTSSLMARSS